MKALIAMSGGVDSSVAALFILQLKFCIKLHAGSSHHRRKYGIIHCMFVFRNCRKGVCAWYQEKEEEGALVPILLL